MNATVHLAVDAVGARYGGGATVLLEFLRAAIANSRFDRITVFCSPAFKRRFEMPFSGKLTIISQRLADGNYGCRLAWYERGLASACRKVGADVLFISANFGSAGFGLPHVTHVQQSLPFSMEAIATHKSAFDRMKIMFYRRQLRRSCTSAARVICQSAVMKSWILNAFKLNPANVSVIYSAPREMGCDSNVTIYSPEKSSCYKTQTLLYVGSDYPHKKLATAVAGINLMREKMPSAELVLTLPAEHIFGREPGVRCVDYLSYDELACAYRSAAALILPSVVESGPQPPLEGMSFGVPVLVADRPYAHDICQNAAMFFDPNSPEDFAEKAVRLLSDDGLRRDLVLKGFALIEERRALRPYEKIVEILLEVVDHRRNQ